LYRVNQFMIKTEAIWELPRNCNDLRVYVSILGT